MPDEAGRRARTAGSGGAAGRISAVDAARGIAILMMVAYHALFDVQYFGMADVGINGLPLTLLQYATGTLFVLVAGISLTLSESRNKEGYVHHVKRAVLLGAVALLITAVTWVYPHDGFIQFGIIHMLALSTLIAPLFLRFGWANAALGFALVYLGVHLNGIFVDTHQFFWLGITDAGYTALDHYPMLPWFGIVLIGMWLGRALFPDGMRTNAGAKGAGQGKNPAEAALAFLGRNSLAIYIAHQPILVGAIMALRLLGMV
jgi:uncharacterized membrane protein